MATTFQSFQRLSATNVETNKSLRVIAFAVMDYWFALPLGAVLKVIPCPAFTAANSGIGIIHLDSQTITVVDLRYKFIKNSNQTIKFTKDSPHNMMNFLIMFQTQNGELCGIPVAKTPILTDIALSNIRPLPCFYQQISELSFIKYVAVIPQEQKTEPLQIFLLSNLFN